MKKILFSTALLLLFLSSCQTKTTPSSPIETPPIVENTPLVQEDSDEQNVQTAPDDELPPKPESVAEIIALADSFELDTSLLNFSLDKILDTVQLGEAEDAGNEYQNSTAYLGDSVTLGLGKFGAHPENMVIAVGSISPFDALTKKLITLENGDKVNFPDALKELNAKRAILTFGANAISVMDESTFLSSYVALIKKIKETSPDCEIIIQSISPIASTCTFKKFTNVLINRSNLLLLIMAYSEDVHFLNSAPLLKGDDGYLKPKYCSSDDGIHINQSGYDVWINFMRTHPLISE